MATARPATPPRREPRAGGAQKDSRRAGSPGHSDPSGCPAYPEAVFQLLQEQGADFLLTVKRNQKTLHRQICSQFQGKRTIPLVATDQEISHGRDITWTQRAKEAPQHIRESWVGTSWILEMTATSIRDGKPFQAQQVFLTSLRTTPEALLQPVRDRWSIEC